MLKHVPKAIVNHVALAQCLEAFLVDHNICARMIAQEAAEKRAGQIRCALSHVRILAQQPAKLAARLKQSAAPVKDTVVQLVKLYSTAKLDGLAEHADVTPSTDEQSQQLDGLAQRAEVMPSTGEESQKPDGLAPGAKVMPSTGKHKDAEVSGPPPPDFDQEAEEQLAEIPHRQLQARVSDVPSFSCFSPEPDNDAEQAQKMPPGEVGWLIVSLASAVPRPAGIRQQKANVLGNSHMRKKPSSHLGKKSMTQSLLPEPCPVPCPGPGHAQVEETRPSKEVKHCKNGWAVFTNTRNGKNKGHWKEWHYQPEGKRFRTQRAAQQYTPAFVDEAA